MNSDETCILIVSDMADLRNMRNEYPEFRNLSFVFSSRDGTKLMGWVPEKIYVSQRATLNMTKRIVQILDHRKAQGSTICPVS